MPEINLGNSVFQKHVDDGSKLRAEPDGRKVEKDQNGQRLAALLEVPLLQSDCGVEAEPQSADLAVDDLFKIHLANSYLAFLLGEPASRAANYLVLNDVRFILKQIKRLKAVIREEFSHF